MPGNITWKELSIITLTSTGASTTTGTAASAGTDLDVRSAGNAADCFAANFLLICQWATVTGIVAGTIVADLYLVPKIDGTNLPQIDTTSGTSYISFNMRVGSFTAAKAPSGNTDTYFVVPNVDLQPLLYTAYIINRSGQTISVNWSLKVVPAEAQYT